ncbi:dehydrogenase [Zafaria cholistanensis]|uniref:Dehydrogenase n=1 Tax=Zafaria cholistanensis TaxID=1682741 RepID=A0A5A7NTE8_9MICC|nr:NAD(P)/FAD-dependent oxidoreductase [Zafaria cholistanensis]GER23011.1 dehydrogenase [Zafaria cholistanensis]
MADAAVVGSGPNGLAAAVTLARAGLSVRVYEAEDSIGGGSRTLELGLPGHRHDIGAAVHPMALASPFFREIGLADRVDFIVPEVSYAHPLPDGRTGLAWRDLERTAEGLGSAGPAYERLFGPLVRAYGSVTDLVLHPLLRMPHGLDGLGATAAFGVRAAALSVPAPVLNSAAGMLPPLLGGAGWGGAGGKDVEAMAALLAGVRAHNAGGGAGPAANGAALVLGTAAHATGWPIPLGGSQAIPNALAMDLIDHGGRIETGRRVERIADLEEELVFCDTSPEDLARIAGAVLPEGYRNRLLATRRGPGSCVVHYVLDGPVPWRDPDIALAGTVHLGGTAADIRRWELDQRGPGSRRGAGGRGRRAGAGSGPGIGGGHGPYVIVSQPSLFDPSRAPAGHHVLWAYCHVPFGSPADMTEAITAQLEAAAPGFRDTVVHSEAMTAPGLQARNANLVGGDISGGAVDLAGMLSRPVLAASPWRTPARGLYLCSSSTPPGPAVHGMCGHLAARTALKDLAG